MKSKILNDEFIEPKELIELSDLIEYELDNFSLDKRSKDFKVWNQKLITLMNTYNKQAGSKLYNTNYNDFNIKQ